MKTLFVTVQVPLQSSTAALRHAIERELERYGVPLRWAITALDSATRMAYVEAVVTTE